MEKEFIPYEQALALKELGFDEPCMLNHYGDERVHVGRLYLPSSFGKGRNSEMHDDSLRDGDVTAILYQQAFRWLRETYNIDVDIIRDSEVHYQDETKWIVKVSNWNDIRVKEFSIAHLKFPDTSHHTDLKSYDEALKIGLEEALKFIKK